MEQASNRRRFISSAVVLGAGIVTACKTSAGGQLLAEGDAAPRQVTGGQVRERVSVYAPEAAAMLALYERAIQAMRRLPATNPLSWEAQAQIHENSCPHNNWFFLPWHRFYLFYFEEACRKALADAGDPAAETFALPYWDWSREQTIPAAFRNRRSPLFNNTRGASSQPRAGQPRRIGDEFVGTATIERLLGTANFYAFASGPAREQRGRGTTGLLEGTPHNRVHVYVDGDMATFLSPRDPIFWLHHCNVDRLWALWTERNRTTALPENVQGFTANDWLGSTMTGFFDRDGRAVTREVRDATDLNNFGYSYRSTTPNVATRGMVAASMAPQAFAAAERAPVLPPPQVFRGVASNKGVEDGHRLTLAVTLNAELVKLLNTFKTQSRGRFLFKAADIAVPSEAARRETFLRFFINETNLRAATERSPGYVASYAWFHHEHADGTDHVHDAAAAAVTLEFDITATLRRLLTASPALKVGQEVLLQVVKLDFDYKPRAFENPDSLNQLEMTLEYQPS